MNEAKLIKQIILVRRESLMLRIEVANLRNRVKTAEHERMRLDEVESLLGILKEIGI